MPVCRLIRGLAAAVALAGALLPAAAPAETLVVAGRPLELAPPFGFCRLSPEVEREAAVAAELARREAEQLRQALAFADCDELEAWRQGRLARIDRLGQIGATLRGGEPVTVQTPARFMGDARKSLTAASARDAAATPGLKVLLVEGGNYLVTGTSLDSPAGRVLQAGALTIIGGVAVEISLFQSGTGEVPEDARRLAENAAALSSVAGEILVVNDVFDEVERVDTDAQAGALNVMTAVAGGLGLFGLLALRSLWLLLRAPRRRI
ncbi:hypothetical protein DES42_10191 [Zavarzinia compransoris]|uniref:Uncharacterized protein n=2 Tax=Zavarzinia compransoris TaxID=1264899 RepID=A0A317DWF3_9PROT|nr:hypothetical protein [Zavarzinia compransoris]PWR18752.1 hypothetical protein DKG75_17350 [Zavarzinia compransoris]TDP48735.1 hypothetical protein DES42_10191 [Zavarzinia compransoris]